jgi:glycosyltransferase involved in cell wall biosynthesis
MGKSPRLAIVIPCYNYEDYVERAIASVAGQLGDDCELVVVDDGSTDGSWAAIGRTGVPAVRVPNGGAVAACVAGLDRTSAPHVLFLDADDELKPGAVGEVLARLDAGVAKLQFGLTRIDADGRRIGGAAPAVEDYRDSAGLVAKVLRTGVYRSPPTSGNVFRRDVADIIREVDYDRYVDGVPLFAAPFMGDVVSLSAELGCYRVHGRNVSGAGREPDAESLSFDLERFVRRMGHLQEVLRRLGRTERMFDPRDVFVSRERAFCVAVASGGRPPLSSLPPLVARLAGEALPLKGKIGMAAFFVLASLLPKRRAKALLNYRFKVGGRSARGFLRTLGAPR